MDEHDERTSLVRSNSTSNRVGSPSHNNNNGYNTGNGHHHQQHNANPTRRDPRSFLAQAQESLGFFQNWAAKILHENQESPIVNWVQNARVARTFMIIMNVVLAVFAFLLMGVEMVEMALREPILDYLLPESEITLLVAGLTIVAGAFGFAVAYNLLVEEDTTINRDDRNNDEGRQGNDSGGNGRDSGPWTPTHPRPTDNMLGQNNDPPLVVQQQQTRRPKLMFTKASTYQLNGYAILLLLVLIICTFSVAQRSFHLSQMDKELNSAWTEAYRHRRQHISDFQLRHQCCGFGHINDRPFPPKKDDPTAPPPCSENIAYGFKVSCRAELSKDFVRWQTWIQHLLLAQVTMLTPLLLLVMTLSVIGFSKLKCKQEGREDAEAQAEATGVVPAVDGRGAGAQFERSLLEDVAPSTPFLVNVEAEPVRQTHDRPIVQPSLI
ncbi:hypothetical protein BGZ47_007950 [Haplosporangium gracile]|nr:hypothetical protein BGZ47_007950 [Haplosporangium gracile]